MVCPGGPAILSATAVGAVVGAMMGGAVEKETERAVELDPVRSHATAVRARPVSRQADVIYDGHL